MSLRICYRTCRILYFDRLFSFIQLMANLFNGILSSRFMLVASCKKDLSAEELSSVFHQVRDKCALEVIEP